MLADGSKIAGQKPRAAGGGGGERLPALSSVAAVGFQLVRVSLKGSISEPIVGFVVYQEFFLGITSDSEAALQP
jgi:hypothetical protein